MGKIIQFARAGASKIDAESRTISGVSLITEGVVQGHDVWADKTTLATLMASAETYAGGLKVKLNHSDNVGDIVGYIDNFSITPDSNIDDVNDEADPNYDPDNDDDDDQEFSHLRGDLHLLENSPSADYVMELASTIPESIGLSVAFSFDVEKVAGLPLPAVRCIEIFSCDLVDNPAANPNGLFSLPPMNEESTANAENKTDAAPVPENPRVTALEATVSSISESLKSFQTILEGIVKAQEIQAAEFAKKLETQTAEFTAQLKDADILAARKLSATGVSAEKSKTLAADNGVLLGSHIAQLEALEDPSERMTYFQKHRALIAKEYAKRK
jgi:hypothetical protein